ncbi:beta-ketoacyl-ACP synthase III [Flavobacterium microcysteis]|uniref:Beta-ketoacyl-[acyl-carrier-protein] synthase III n=1 Tax=Flavobacterium microcysteis TaxID=2596891 RepID=A0A501Q0U3_9FLAO|nr:beta-ketoacyl-ACP synthase III [Flavobacterium microcysteis]TPD65827.1 ketoacyl-ACP synthase III [Flavobacterium microcysteis]
MSQEIKAAITAVGGYVPDTILDNFQLEKLVDTSDEWIVARTGIKERRILADKQKATSDMAAAAITELLAEYSVKAEEIDCVLLATSTPDKLLAPTAPIVCTKAGLRNAWGLDINAACSGFLYALSVGAAFIESRRFKKVLVVGADTMSRIVDYTDRNTCILFGDGAGAVLLEPSSNYGLHDFIFKTDGTGNDFLSIPAGGSLQPVGDISLHENLHYVKQDGRTVFKNAISGMTSSCDELLMKNGFDADAIDWIIPHQANLRIINAVADNLKVPMSKVKVNIQRYGNTTAATIPLCLWDFKNDFKQGDRIFLTAFGAGFTYGSSYLTWGN